MEILFIPRNTADELMNIPLNEIESKFLEDIKIEFINIDPNYSLREVNLGTGADWALILAIINGATTIFLLGDKIDKGIEGWINVGKRIKSLFQKTDIIYLDLHAAKLLALQYIAEKHKINSISLVKESEEVVLNLSSMLRDRKPNDFISKPYNIYFLTFRINENMELMLSVRSDGEIKELYSYDDNSWHPF